MSIEILKQRRSIRKYETRQVPEEILDQILEAGTYAPTGMNRQSPVMVAVQDPEIIRLMEKENAKAMGSEDGTPFYGAPTVVVVFADTRCRTGFEDACLVMGNLLNAASILGIGSCWIHRAKEVFEDEEAIALLRSQGLEGDYLGIGHCVLGYPVEPAGDPLPRKENRVFYID